MKRIGAFGRFWWDFVIGDDWRIAAAAVAGIALTALLAANGIPAWWVLPAVVLGVLVLPFSAALIRPPARRLLRLARRSTDA